MSTIPASFYVNVIPGVLNAGGNALVLNGIAVTENTRVPIGTVLSFPSSTAVSSYFGDAANETNSADVYFAGYENSTQKPGSMLFAQYPQGAVSAYLRGGNISGLTIQQLAALSGSLTVIMDGYTFADASLNLSGATSFSAAAALIQSGLNGTLPTEASVTGSIAAETASVTASISGYVMYVTNIGSGTLVPGAVLAGANVSAGTEITSQLSGTAGGVGTYAVSIKQNVLSTTVTASYGLLTVTVVAFGTLSVGQTISGAGITVGTILTALGTGEGLDGTYYVNLSQTVASESAILGKPTALTVTFDSVSGGFVITSGITGASSGAAFATGTLAPLLLLTSATGAVLSPGSDAMTPAAFMASLTSLTQNWASFYTTFDPDNNSGVNVQKLAFAAWTNTTDNRYAYICWDTDITPTESATASSSLGYILKQGNYSGTCMIYQPGDLYLAAFISGAIASIDFNAVNGRITFDYKSQTGLIASVTTETAAANLIANGYNYYGAVATANQGFLFFDEGSVSGPFEWLDSYVNQIALNAAFQLAFLELLTQITSIPYTTAGYGLIEAAAQDPIQQFLNFGAFRPGVPLSNAQVAEINNAAGLNIAPVLQQQGWYFQVIPATPQQRQARQSPGCTFWYADGEAVQRLTINSIDVQ